MKRRQPPQPLDQLDSDSLPVGSMQKPTSQSKRLRSADCPLLATLWPILSIFHSFLTDDDAARLLRTSHTAALALLPSYTFSSHIFSPVSITSLRRLRDLCLTYHLRITQLGLPHNIQDLTFDPTPPHLSPIPPSVISLTLCCGHAGHVEPDWAAFSAVATDWYNREPWRLLDLHPSPQWLGEEGTGWQLTEAPRYPRSFDESKTPTPCFTDPSGDLNCPLPPGLLPSGLRVLRINRAYSQPLQPGSLPSTLTFLQLASVLDLPTAAGALPASLVHLSLGPLYSQPLRPGSLPASLERLNLWSYSLPLQVGTLPSQLKALHLGEFNRRLRPHVLPPSLLYLTFSTFNQPLLPDVLPPRLIDLHLGDIYDQFLSPGALPSSLRRLTLGREFKQPLEVGSLPEGLLFLRFVSGWDLPQFEPGVLPSTLLGVDFTDRYVEPLTEGLIPSAVQWIRLSSAYRDEPLEAALPPHARVRWY